MISYFSRCQYFLEDLSGRTAIKVEWAKYLFGGVKRDKEHLKKPRSIFRITGEILLVLT